MSFPAELISLATEKMIFTVGSMLFAEEKIISTAESIFYGKKKLLERQK